MNTATDIPKAVCSIQLPYGDCCIEWMQCAGKIQLAQPSTAQPSHTHVSAEALTCLQLLAAPLCPTSLQVLRCPQVSVKEKQRFDIAMQVFDSPEHDEQMPTHLDSLLSSFVEGVRHNGRMHPSLKQLKTLFEQGSTNDSD